MTDNEGAPAILHEEYQILERVNIGFVSIDDEGHVIYWNLCATTLFGWTKDEVIGTCLSEFFIPLEHRKVYLAAMERMRTDGEEPGLYETIALHRTKGRIPVEFNIFKMQLNDHYTLHAVIRDLSARKKAEEGSNIIFEAIPDATIMVNQQGQIVYLNSQTGKLFGYQKDELIGQPVEILIPEPYKSRHPEHVKNYFISPDVRPMGVGLELYV